MCNCTKYMRAAKLVFQVSAPFMPDCCEIRKRNPYLLVKCEYTKNL